MELLGFKRTDKPDVEQDGIPLYGKRELFGILLKAEGESPPETGTVTVVVNGSGEPMCIVETIESEASMGFLKKLFSSGSSSPSSDFYTFNVRCDRCGENIEGRINLANDLSADDEGAYRVRKVLMGSERCFKQIEVILQYDAARQLQEKEIHGGKFVE